MSRQCDVCGKATMTGNAVSRKSRWITGRSKRVWAPNIQRIRVRPAGETSGETKQINVCTRCMRSGKVNRAV